MNTIRFSLLSFFVFAPAVMMAQANDTLIINNPSQVIISQSSNALAVKISGKDGNPDYRFSREVSLSNQSEVSTSQSMNRRSPLSWDFKEIEKDDKTSQLELAFFKDFSYGFLMQFDRPQGMDDVKFFQSYETSLTMMSFIYYPGHSRNWYSLDANLNYRHITMKGNMRFETQQGGNLHLAPYPEGAKPENSMMQILKPELALNFYRSFHKDFSFGLGIGTMFGGYTNYCNSRSNYTDKEGNKIHEANDVRDIFGFNLSVKAQLMFNGFGGFYIKYYPKSGFKSNHGPQFQSLSAGLIFRVGM